MKRDKYDAVFSDLVRTRANHTCESCGRQGRTECAHIYGRANKAVRWDAMNAVCLCHTCHRTFTANPLDFQIWCRDYLGKGHLMILNEKRRAIKKWTPGEKEEMLAHYRAELKRLMEMRDHGEEGHIQFTNWS